MKNLLPLAFLLLSLPVAAQELKPVPVVELFTSQGCNSCPPADAALGAMAQRADVLALSLHVDYWDYLGWKDSFSTTWATARQRAYAKSFRSRSVYTPQAIVNGAGDAVGSDRGKVQALLAKAKVAAFSAAVDGARAVLTFAADGIPADIVLVDYLASAPVVITRGENAGNTFTYHNVVRRLDVLGTWDGKAGHAPVALPPRAAGQSRALMVQGQDMGPLLGGVRLPDGPAAGI